MSEHGKKRGILLFSTRTANLRHGPRHFPTDGPYRKIQDFPEVLTPVNCFISFLYSLHYLRFSVTAVKAGKRPFWAVVSCVGDSRIWYCGMRVAGSKSSLRKERHINLKQCGEKQLRNECGGKRP